LLHHLPDPFAAVNGLLPHLAPGAIWFAGHEPSRRFWANADCQRLYARYWRERAWTRFFSVRSYVQAAQELLGFASHASHRTASAACAEGLFRRKPPAWVIRRIVDVHVVSSPDQVLSGLGFDFEAMRHELQVSWDLLWVESYSFMGPVYEGRLSRRWRRRCHELKNLYPRDGANFCSVWRSSL
jgi:hypothetical protein